MADADEIIDACNFKLRVAQQLERFEADPLVSQLMAAMRVAGATQSFCFSGLSVMLVTRLEELEKLHERKY